MGAVLRPPTLPDEVEIRATAPSELQALPLQPPIFEPPSEEARPRTTWHLAGVILLVSGLAGIAYAGVRIVVDQRMAVLYREPVTLDGWRLLTASFVVLLSGAAILVTIERRS